MKDDYAIVKRLKSGESVPAGSIPADLVRTSAGTIHVSTADGAKELVHAANINTVLQAAGGAGWEKVQVTTANYSIVRLTSGASLDLHIEVGGTLAALTVANWPIPASGVEQLRIRNMSAIAQSFTATGFSGIVTADGNPATSGAYSIPIDMAVHITIDEDGWIQVTPMGQEVSQAEFDSAMALKANATSLTDGSVQALFDTLRADAIHFMAASTDLNALTGTGWYNIQNATNGPAGGGWYYFFNGVHRSTATGAPSTVYGFQIAKRLDLAGTNNLLMRVNTNNSWTAWATLATIDVATTTVAGLMAAADKTKLDGVATSAAAVATTGTPAMDGTAALGAGTTSARADHVHPSDTSRAPLASPAFTGTVSGITKTMVGLSSADNTADTAKPVSTAQQTALDLKADNTDLTDSSVDIRARTIAAPAVEYDAALDTNAMVLTGVFNVNANANMPNATDWFYLENFIHRTSNTGNAATPAYQYQRATGMNAAATVGRTWQRSRNNGTWTAWREITRAVAGGGTLAAGTVTITDAAAATASRIMLTRTGAANAATLAVTTKSAGSFVVTSSSGADTGTFDYMIF